MPHRSRAIGPIVALLIAPHFACGGDEPSTRAADLPTPPDTSRLAELVDDLSRSEIVRADAALAGALDSAKAWSQLGIAYETAHLESRAEQCYRAAAALEPKEPRHLYRAAVTAQRGGEALRALDDMQRVVELEPSYGPAWRRLAFWRIDIGDIDGARAAAERAEALLGGAPDPHIVRARVELLADNAELALKAAREAARLAPDDPYARLILGEALRRAGQTDEAAPHLAAGENSSPRFADPWSEDIARARNRESDLADEGVRLEREGKFEQALKRFDRVLARRPDDSNMLHHKGNALLGAKRNDEALAHLEAAHATLPGDFDIAITRVRALRATQDAAGALAAAEALAARFPDNVQAHVVVGQLRADLGNVDAALASLDRAIGLSPHNTRALLVKGSLLAQGRRFEEAVFVLEQGLDGNGPPPPLGYFKLLLAAQSYAGVPEARIQTTYARAVDAHGEAAMSLLEKR